MHSLVFLTGCGRSGTTILGELLDQHPDVVYLNDRFDLWVEALPRADIWGFSKQLSTGADHPRSIELTAQDLEEPGVQEAIDLIRTRLDRERGDAPVLIEKLAINNFRLGFLHAAFPEAAFINITRNGIEVAASIARKIESGQWFGERDRKWTLLCEHADRVGLGDLARTCESPLERGLLEWRMSVDAARTFFSSAPGVRAIRVTYEQLLSDPREIAGMLAWFLDLPDHSRMEDWAAQNIARRSPAATEADASIIRAAERIAGPTLRRLGYTLPAGANTEAASAESAH